MAHVSEQKLGKLAARDDDRTLMLTRYVDAPAVLPRVPESVFWSLKVPSFPMYANNRLGDCTCAAAGHMIQTWTANVGKLATPSEHDVLAAYWATGRADTGRFCVDVLNYWRQHGIAGHRIEAYVKVDVRNPAELAAAHYLFGGLYVGVQLPLSAQTQQRWQVTSGPDSAPGSWGGHCVPLTARWGFGWTAISWGRRIALSSAFFKAYCDEAYAILSTDWINAAGTDPSGIKLADLRRDLAAVSR